MVAEGYRILKKAVLICPRCGRIVERLLALPIPRKHRETVDTEGVVCERCLLDLEIELNEEETASLPPR